MKSICVGYTDMSSLATIPEADLKRAMDDCFDYGSVPRAGDQFVGFEALQEPSKAITLRFAEGNVQATDGPYAETKEQLEGILVLEAECLEHSVALMSKHPAVRLGPSEIRPTDETIKEFKKARHIS